MHIIKFGLLAAFSLGAWRLTAAEERAPAARSAAALVADDNIADKLLQRVSYSKPQEVKLAELLDHLNAEHGLNILVDGRFAEEGLQPDHSVRLPAMKNVRLETVLKMVCDQVDGVYLIFPDHIRIVTLARAVALIKPAADEQARDATNAEVRDTPLVTYHFEEQPLNKVLREIESRTNTTILISNRAAESAKAAVTGRLKNVAVDRAVGILAEMAGLAMVSRGNLLFVTTPEDARRLNSVPTPST